ncbi:MAG TPA: hypothetical protein VM010_07510 [Chitinophagaceae bacterium]|nr:hypothetical protein [Chitinophagaceae bacterium]
MKQHLVQRLQQVFPFLFFSILHSSAGAQNLEKTLAVYAEKYAQERAYLHYDKGAYAAGETIWFKAYLLEGILPAPGSKTLYVDWVDESGAVLKHTVSPVVTAVANGQFDVPVDYSGRFIHVRAYTTWMLNFDTAFLYNRDIRIIGNTKPGVQKAVAIVPSLQLFPEGGDAITGLQNKIAFKAADQWGRPVLVSGVVQASSGKTVATFAAQHDGMGFFLFEPEAGSSYTAKWKDEKGAVHTTALPIAKKEGIVLQLAIEESNRRFVLTRTATAPDVLKQLHLVGTMGENFVFKADVDLANRKTTGGLIPTAALPSGILTITIFDAAWNAVAERITFVNNNDYHFEPQLDVQHWGLNRRARNVLEIKIPDSLEANLSLAVTDNALPGDSSETIISRLLLTSDIKGMVPHPAYYFTANTDTVRQRLDLVMLTHGWRRFKWEDVVSGKMPLVTYPKDTAFLTLSGRLYGMPQGTSSGSIIMFLKTKDSASKMIMEAVGPDGRFNIPDALFFDTLNVYYQLQPAKILKGAEARFMESRLPPLNYKGAAQGFRGFPYNSDTAGNYRLLLLAQEQARATELLKQKTLENVTVRAKTKTPVQVMDTKYASGLFTGTDGYQFDLVNDPLSSSYQNIFMYLQGKVAGLQISGNGGNTSLQWRGGKPAVYLDQINTDVDMLSSLPVSDIAYVKVFRPPFMGGFNGANGAIAIYTRKGTDAAVTPGKGLNNNTISGYTPVKEFYAPNYDSFKARNEQRDLRTTLYWNPLLLLTPKNRTVTVTFYNNDVTKAFRVILEGFTSDGRLTHIEQVLE